jgi:hypothetical protein
MSANKADIGITGSAVNPLGEIFTCLIVAGRAYAPHAGGAQIYEVKTALTTTSDPVARRPPQRL